MKQLFIVLCLGVTAFAAVVWADPSTPTKTNASDSITQLMSVTPEILMKALTPKIEKNMEMLLVKSKHAQNALGESTRPL